MMMEPDWELVLDISMLPDGSIAGGAAQSSIA
jgi:hypothetical protein